MRIPYYKQETQWTCGAASMRMVLASMGKVCSERYIAKLLKTSKRTGTKHKHMVQLAEQYKLTYVVSRNASLEDVAFFLKRKYRVIVCYQHPKDNAGHYAIVRGLTQKRIRLLDPLDGPGVSYSRAYFEDIWRDDPDDDNERHWLLGIKP